MMDKLTFGAPWMLVLVALLLLVAWIATRTRTSLARRHLRVATGLRMLALAALAAALAGPAWHGITREVSVVYALDVSHSVAPQFVEAALGWIDDANRRWQPARSRVVAFAEQARMVAKADDVRALRIAENPGGDASDVSAGVLNQSATNLERAVEVALLGFEPNTVRRLVLLTDGNATAGDLWKVLPRLRAEGVRVYTVPAKTRDETPAGVEAIDVPGSLWRNGPATVTVRVNSARAGSARVSLREGEKPLGTRAVTLKDGSNEVSLDVRLTRSGAALLSADVVMDGEAPQAGARLQRSVWVGTAPRVMYVEGHTDSARYLRDALAVQGIDVVLKGAGDLPSSADGYAGYDAVILSDVPPDQVDEARMEAAETWVRDSGGGFLFAAGESTYGEKGADQKGYAGSRLEKILPVQFQAQEKKKELAMVIAIDRSYSMKGRKMNFAKEAARATLDLLEEQHRLAVVAFDSQPYISVPMQTLKAKRKVEDLISRIQASGQTNVYPALQIAFRMLNEQDVKSKHVILLSDGDTTPADFQRLVTRMADAKITVSTVTLAGEGADYELMADIAKWGRGRNYRVDDVATLPQIFIDETQKAVRSNLVENAFRPVVKRKLQALNGVDFSKVPELKGYISSKARDTADLMLVSDTGAPVLARWQYGLGRTVVFTSDVKNRWAAEWLGWDGYGKLWAQLVRDTLRRPDREELAFNVTREGGEARIEVSALTPDGRFVSGLKPRVRIFGQGQPSRTIELVQRSPGVYSARLPVRPAATPVEFELLESAGMARSTIQRTGTRSLVYPVSDEYQSRPPNVELLKTLAQETGGRYAPDASEVFANLGDSQGRARPLWPWLAGLALLCYLLELWVRRAPLAWRLLGS